MLLSTQNILKLIGKKIFTIIQFFSLSKPRENETTMKVLCDLLSADKQSEIVGDGCDGQGIIG